MAPTNHDEDLVLLSGYGQVPEGISSRALYRSVGLVLVVRRSTGEVVAVDSTLLTDLATDFLRSLIEGMSLRDDAEAIVARVSKAYQGHSRGAVVESLRRVIDRYEAL